MKKLISALLLAALAVSCVSCASNGGSGSSQTEKTSQSQTAAQTTELSSAAILPGYDFGGKTYKILGRDYAKFGDLVNYEFTVESENGDLVNDTVYLRTRTVEDNFNVVIKSERGTASTLIPQAVLAGDYAYDLVWAHINDMTTLSNNGYLYNYSDIAQIDMSKPWWNQTAAKALTVNGRVYLQMNYIPYTGMLLTHNFFFNKKLAETYKVENLYDTVRAGKWTFDKLLEASQLVSADLNGDGKYDQNDLFGLACSHGIGSIAAAGASLQYSSFNADGSVKLTLFGDRTQSLLDKLIKLTTAKSTYLLADYARENELAQMFADGRSLFLASYLSNAYQFFRNMNDDFGLLPLPKYDESQDAYYTTVTGGTGLLGIPLTVADPEFTGVVTEALAIESYKYVYPAVYQTVVEDKLLRDADSSEMYSIIVGGITFSFARVYKSGYGNYADILDNLVQKGSSDLSSAYASVQAGAQEYYDKVLQSFYK